MLDQPTSRGITSLAAVLLMPLTLGACGPAVVDTAVQPGAMVLSDANVSSVFGTANMGEVQLANLALQRSRNEAVRAYAQRMIQDHTMANQQLERILQNAGMTAVPVEATQQLETTVTQTMETLQGLSGAAFDRTYMQSQVDIHRWLLQTLDEALIPSARRGDLGALLRQNREIVAVHLQQAQQIHDALSRD